MENIRIFDLFHDSISKETLVGINEIASQYLSPKDIELSLKNIVSAPKFDEIYSVIKQNERILGYCGLRKAEPRLVKFTDANAGELNALFIDLHSRNKGIGGILFSHVVEIAKERSYSYLVCKSSIIFKESGWGFYDKMKMQRIGMITDDMMAWKMSLK